LHDASAFHDPVSGFPRDPSRGKPGASRDTIYVGYLVSTFTDANPKVQQYLSNGNSAYSFRFLNDGNPVLASTVGTQAVRDIFLATNTARSELYLLATG
jgi:hypothetical protein